MDQNSAFNANSNSPSDSEKQTQEINNPLIDPESSVQPVGISVEPPPKAAERAISSPADTAANHRSPTARRKDTGRRHAIRHGALSRYPLEALARLGENIRPLRDYERALRKELKPSGVLGAILFDRFWSSYLRCLLAARADAAAFNPADRHAGMPGRAAAIIDDELPTLISIDDSTVNYFFSTELFKQLALVEKYDRHFSREMYRALAMLLAAKSGDQSGMERCLRQALPSTMNHSEGSADE